MSAPGRKRLLRVRLWIGLLGALAWLGGVRTDLAALRWIGVVLLAVALALRWMPRARRRDKAPTSLDGA